MKRRIIVIVIVIILLALLAWLFRPRTSSRQTEPQANQAEQQSGSETASGTPPSASSTTPPELPSGFSYPINHPLERVTKKPFGIYVSPNNSPVSPEKFTGYHTGVDFETFPDEQDSDVPVYAVCNGKLIDKRTASGYGGVLVQACSYEGKEYTIVYGHVRLSSVSAKVGDTLQAGNQLAVLGAGYSPETDGERKHLHLGIHKGSGINITGYVQNKNELSNWVDVSSYQK